MPAIREAVWKPFKRQIQQFSASPDAARDWTNPSRFRKERRELLKPVGVVGEKGSDRSQEFLNCYIKRDRNVGVVYISSHLTRIRIFSARTNNAAENYELSLADGALDSKTGEDLSLGGFIAALDRLATNVGILTQKGVRTCTLPDGTILDSTPGMDPAWVTPGLNELLSHMRLYAIARSLCEVVNGKSGAGRKYFIDPYLLASGEIDSAGILDDDETRRIFSEILTSVSRAIRTAPFAAAGNPLSGVKQQISFEWNQGLKAQEWFMGGAFSPLSPQGTIGKYTLDLSQISYFLGFEPEKKT